MGIKGFFRSLLRQKSNDNLNTHIQATEGDRNVQDPLQTPVTTTTRIIRKNNFTTYDNIVSEIKDKYICFADYGVSLLGTVIDMRAAFIGGEGVSIVASNKKTQEFIDKLLDWNSFKDGYFIELVEEAEKEGKCLVLIKSIEDDKEKKILYKHVPYVPTHYKVEKDDFNRAQKVEWQPDKENKKTYDKKDFIYVWFTGNSGDLNDTPPRVGRVLTQIENYERALYDLRESNHLFGFTTPVFETKDEVTARRVTTQVNTTDWTIGKSIAVPASVKYLSPGSGALETLRGEMSLNLKLISSNTGMPVHWLGWTDLMSNRATADTLTELIELTTKKDRLKWKKAIKELIRKSMIKAVDTGVPGAINDPDGFEVELPQLTAEKLKEIIEVWLPLRDGKHISESTFLNKVPGVDPAEEKRFLEKEEKEAEKKKPEEVKRFEQDLNKINKENNEDVDLQNG